MSFIPPVIAELVAQTEEYVAAMREAQAGTAEAAESIDASTDSMSGSWDAVGGSADAAAGEVTAASAEMDTTAGATDATAASMGGLAKAGLIVAAALAAAGVVSLDLGEKYQTATNTLAANADISIKAAQKIGNAFTNQAFTTIYSAQQTMEAYSSVAGELGSVEGHALTSAQALKMMKAAQDLAEASGTDLSSATSDLGSIMQAYGQKAGSATDDSNILFSAGRLLQGGLSTVTSAVLKLRAGLGSASPSLSQTGALLLDLANNGETGRKAVSAVTTAISSLVKQTVSVTQQQQTMKASLDGLTGQARTWAQELQDGTIGAYTYSQNIEALSGNQYNLASAFGSAYSSMTAATEKLNETGITVVNAQGQFIGLKSIIAQLGAEYTKSGYAQTHATAATLFGSMAAEKLMGIIEAGPAAYRKYLEEVNKKNAAEKAAEKQEAAFDEKLKTLESGVEDLGVKVGGVLVPAITRVIGGLEDAARFFMKNRAAAIALGVVVGGILTTVIAAYTVSMGAAAVATVAATWPILAIIAGVGLLVAAAVLLATHWKAVWSAVGKAVDDAVRFVEGLIGNVVNWIKQHWQLLLTILTGPFGLAISWVATHFKQIEGTVKTVIGDVRNFFADAGTWLLDAGKQIVMGLVHGITGAVGDAVNAVKHIGSSVINAAKSIFSIFSPSGVFSDIGNNVTLGLAQGIRAQLGEAVAAARQVGQAVTQQGQNIALAAPGVGGVSPVGLAAAGGAAAGPQTITIEAHNTVQVAGPFSAEAQAQVRKLFDQYGQDLVRQLIQTR